ncbi:MAG: Hcp family type VI secretion system effector [Rubripirellula sp.]
MASADFFLKLDDIKGESQDKKYKDYIDVLAWSWGISNSGSFHIGGGGGVGKASFGDIAITKYLDASSPILMKYVATGDHFAKGTLICRKPGGKKLDYMKIELENVLITSISDGGSGGEALLTESITLNFQAFDVAYKEQKKDGSGSAAITFDWNIAKNTSG